MSVPLRQRLRLNMGLLHLLLEDTDLLLQRTQLLLQLFTRVQGFLTKPPLMFHSPEQLCLLLQWMMNYN